MSPTHGRDPVTAISEAEATGRTAEIFADIREVMHIPLITSIWRTLADIEDGLEATWAATRPIYETGQPDAALQALKARSEFPVPGPLSADTLGSAGLLVEDRPAFSAVINAYNRSNGMNLIALNALVVEPSGQASSYALTSPDPWPELRPLLEKEEIAPEAWALLERVKLLGAVNDNPSIATLWRHLAHWPGLLSLVIESYEPMQQEGAIAEAIEGLMQSVLVEAAGISHFKPSTADIPDEAWQMVVGYSSGVSRMVTLGHGVAQWIKAVE
jgi:hypothetical protein